MRGIYERRQTGPLFTKTVRSVLVDGSHKTYKELEMAMAYGKTSERELGRQLWDVPVKAELDGGQGGADRKVGAVKSLGPGGLHRVSIIQKSLGVPAVDDAEDRGEEPAPTNRLFSTSFRLVSPRALTARDIACIVTVDTMIR